MRTTTTEATRKPRVKAASAKKTKVKKKPAAATKKTKAAWSRKTAKH